MNENQQSLLLSLFKKERNRYWEYIEGLGPYNVSIPCNVKKSKENAQHFWVVIEKSVKSVTSVQSIRSPETDNERFFSVKATIGGLKTF